MPYTEGVYLGLVTSVLGGGRVWVEHPGEKQMFWVSGSTGASFVVRIRAGSPPFALGSESVNWRGNYDL